MANMVAGDNGAGATTLVLTVPTTSSGVHRALLICPRGSVAVTSVTDNIGADTWSKKTAADPDFLGANPLQCWSPASYASGVTTVTINLASSIACIAFWIEDPEVDTSVGFVVGVIGDNGSVAVTSWTSHAAGSSGGAAVGYGISTSGAGSDVSFVAGAGWTAFSGTGITTGHHGNTADGDDMFAERQIFGSAGGYSADGTSTSVTQNSAIFLFRYAAAVTSPGDDNQTFEG